MLDVLNEGLTLAEVTKLIPAQNGKRLNQSTIWRWCRVGVRSRNGERHRLAHARIGKRLVVSRDALNQFFENVAAGDLEDFDKQQAPPMPRPKKPTPKQRQRQVDEAKAILRKAGILCDA